jgi:hypothetical protein
LLADPHRPVHQAHTFVGFLKSQSIGFTAQQLACRGRIVFPGSLPSSPVICS